MSKRNSAAKPPERESAVVPKSKPGKVIRLDPTLMKLVLKEKGPKETMSAVLRRLLALPPKREKLSYVLPSDLFRTIAEARGRAVLIAVKSGKKRATEKPIAVREAQ